MTSVDAIHFLSMDVIRRSNYYSYFNYHIFCNTLYPSDPSGDTNNEAPTLKKESTLLLQDHSDNHT